MRASRAFAAIAVAFVAANSPVMAQTWTPPAGSGTVDVLVQAIDNAGHRLDSGARVPDGRSTNVSVGAEMTFGITDRFAIGAGLPYVFAKYRGPGPALADLPVDRCRCWHSTFQDVGVSARYRVTTGALAVTTMVGAGVPSHDYVFKGEAVAGRNLNELRVGVNASLVGGISGLAGRRVALSASYMYAVVERVLDVPNNRSNFAAGASWDAVPLRLSVHGEAMWQHTHGGIATEDILPPAGPVNVPELFDQHDRFLRDNNLRVGFGATWRLDRFDVFGTYVEFVNGVNTHDGRAFTGGISRSFMWK